MCGQLSGAVGTLTHRFDVLATLGRAQVGPVTGRLSATRRLEDQRSRGSGRETAVNGSSARNQEVHDQPGYWGGNEQRVEPIHDSPVPGQEGAHVLDTEISLDHRFDQVPAGSGSHQADAENEAAPERNMKNEKAMQTPAAAPNTSDPPDPPMISWG